jgi:hypothetical protein
MKVERLKPQSKRLTKKKSLPMRETNRPLILKLRRSR